MDTKKVKVNTSTPSGCLELLPEEQIEFDRIKSIVENTYRSFGFSALDTPVIERTEVLLAKEAKEVETEARKNIYLVHNRNADFNDRDVDLALRFDLTVPLARYVAHHYNDLSFPFRRYHIAKVYRGERAAHGRFREFYQCDIDVIGRGELSVKYDAEIPAIIYQLFRTLDFGKFTIRVNNRKLLNGLLKGLGIDGEDNAAKVLNIIDEIEKIPAEVFNTKLAAIGLGADQIEKLNSLIRLNGKSSDVVGKLKALPYSDEQYQMGVEELNITAKMMKDIGVDEEYFKIDLSVVRGLDYYTGTVYETVLDDYPKLGSICSGGRYDNLASLFTKENLPGVGISIGLTRLFFQLRELGLIKGEHKTSADVIVVPFDNSCLTYSLSVAKILRQSGWNVDVLFEDLKKKFNYVDKKDAAFTVVAGSDEISSNSVRLQYKANSELVKTNVPIDEIVNKLSSLSKIARGF